MKTLLLSISVLLLSFLCTAQDSAKINQLLKQLKVETTDTGRVMRLNDLFMQHRDFDSAKAMDFANQGLALSEKIKFDKGQSLLLINKGVFLNLNGENEKAVETINQSLAIRKRTDDFSGQGSCLRAIGTISFDKNDYQKALEWYVQSAEAFEKAKDEKGLSGAYIWMGNVFNDGLKNYPKAVEYFSKSIAISKALKDTPMIGYNLNNLGQANFFQKNYTEALRFYFESKSLKERIGDKRGIGNAFNNISSIYNDQGEYAKALPYNDSSLAIRKALGDKKGISTSLANAANIYRGLKNYAASFAATQEAMTIAKEIGFQEPIIEGYNSLSLYYEATGNLKEALRYQRMYKDANDSIFNKDMSEQISTLQTQYESAKQETKIEAQQKELILKEEKQKQLLYGSLAGFLLLGLGGFAWYNNHKRKQQKQMDAVLLKEQELKNKAVIEAEDKERIRIARELHDGVGQTIGAAVMHLDLIGEVMQKQAPEKMEQYEKVKDLLNDGAKELRVVSHSMIPNALLRSGLATAVREFVNRTSSDKLKFNLDIVGLNERLPEHVETGVFRVLQELVTNILKHANATIVGITITRDEKEITLMVEDNGSGFDNKHLHDKSGIGLKNIMSRIAYLQGNVDWDSQPSKGTTVTCNVPIVAA
jgi:two-component system, NarL family, sensor kinase